MTFGMISTTMFYYTIAIDKAFLRSSGSGVAFTQMSTMEDIWKVGLRLNPGAISADVGSRGSPIASICPAIVKKYTYFKAKNALILHHFIRKFILCYGPQPRPLVYSPAIQYSSAHVTTYIFCLQRYTAGPVSRFQTSRSILWMRYCSAYCEPMTSHAAGYGFFSRNDVMTAILKV